MKRIIVAAVAVLCLIAVVVAWIVLPSSEERQIIAVARKAISTNGSWSTYKVKHNDDGGWTVFIQDWPPVDGGHCIVVIDKNKVVTRILRGK